MFDERIYFREDGNIIQLNSFQVLEDGTIIRLNSSQVLELYFTQKSIDDKERILRDAAFGC